MFTSEISILFSFQLADIRVVQRRNKGFSGFSKNLPQIETFRGIDRNLSILKKLHTRCITTEGNNNQIRCRNSICSQSMKLIWLMEKHLTFVQAKRPGICGDLDTSVIHTYQFPEIMRFPLINIIFHILKIMNGENFINMKFTV